MAGRTSSRLIVAIAVSILASRPGAAGDTSACARTGDEPVEVASVDAGLEIVLVDGRRIRLAGLDPAAQTPSDPDRAATARVAMIGMLWHKAVTIEILSVKPDRWGRTAAFVFATRRPGGDSGHVVDEAQEGGVAAAAIAGGLGRYRPEAAAHVCRAAFVAAEEAARLARLGLWNDPYYAVLAVDDSAAFAERSGTFVVMEGQLQTVSPGPYRTKLKFATRERGSYGGHTLTVTILRRTMKTFEAQHVNFPSLIGRSIRARGLLDQRFGPQIEISGPDDIDVLDETPVAVHRDATPPTRSN